MLLQLTFSEAVPGFDPVTSLRAEEAELAQASRSADNTTFYVLAAGGKGEGGMWGACEGGCGMAGRRGRGRGGNGEWEVGGTEGKGCRGGGFTA